MRSPVVGSIETRSIKACNIHRNQQVVSCQRLTLDLPMRKGDAMTKKMRLVPDGSIVFPPWVSKPTACRTVTNKVVAPRNHLWLGSPHGAMVYYDTRNATPCIVTGLMFCHERKCELHWATAPLRLEK